MGRIKKLSERHADRATFLLVYLDDEHANPASVKGSNWNEEMRDFIRDGIDEWKLTFDCVLDEDHQMQKEYDASPARIVIVDRDGRIAFDSGRIDGGAFDLDGIEKWLEE